jgi:hypothetical protein
MKPTAKKTPQEASTMYTHRQFLTNVRCAPSLARKEKDSFWPAWGDEFLSETGGIDELRKLVPRRWDVRTHVVRSDVATISQVAKLLAKAL